MKTLGERIRELRESLDLSLREFAEKLGGLSAAFLSDVELGRRHPSDKVLSAMARVLKTPLEELRKHDTRPPIEDLKRLTTSNPAYGVALRKIVDKQVSPEEIIKLAVKTRSSGKRQ
jgi:transcriptional regulator with XRE-family HTH domain